MSAKPFTDTLRSLRFGTLQDDLTDQLHELTQKIIATQKQGVLTLKLTLKPGKGGQIEVFDDISVKAPKEERGSSIMFTTPEGNLTRDDPRQMSISGLRTIDQATGELRQVGA